METKTSCNTYRSEYGKIMKIVNFRLPNVYKRVGVGLALAILIFLIGYKFLGSNDIVVKDFCRNLMLVFLLVASLSKEKFEDEYTNHIRSQSYLLAFVCALSYSLFLPLVAYFLDLLISQVNADNVINYHEVSGFEVMFMLMCFQLLFFEVLKRFARA